MIRRKIFSGVLIAGFFLCTAAWAGKIVYPWRATTAIVKAGEHVEVWFDADEGQVVQSVALKGAHHSITADQRASTGEWVYDTLSENTYNTKINVMVPGDAPADRYTLVLHTTSGDEVSSGAVKVIKAYRDQYYVLQWSDAHRWQGGHDGMHTMRKVSEILKIANIIDPEIIIETGDNMYNVRNHPEREHSYFHGFPDQGILGMHDTQAATFMAAGNHDSPNNNYNLDADVKETADFFNTFYGLYAHNFTYGSGRFCMFNDAWGAEAVDVDGQAREAAVWLDQVGNGNFVLGAAHIFGGEFSRFDRQVKVDIGLVGHNHHKAPENPHPANKTPKLFVANSVREPAHFEFNLFRVNNKTGACVPVSGPAGRCQVIQADTPELIAEPSRWVPNLERTFEHENDGSSEVNTVRLTNRYFFPIIGAKVRFIMPMGTTYAVTGGVVEQAFDGDSVRVVDVRVTIGENSTATISMMPADRL